MNTVFIFQSKFWYYTGTAFVLVDYWSKNQMLDRNGCSAPKKANSVSSAVKIMTQYS